MTATARETVTNHLLRLELRERRTPRNGDLPRTSWPESHTLGYDVWNGMTLCPYCAIDADKGGALWNPQHDYFLRGVRSVTTPCRCGNCGDPIGEHSPEGVFCEGCGDSVCEGDEVCAECESSGFPIQ